MAGTTTLLDRLRRRSFGRLAALCLVAGWLHAGLHLAADADAGHFGSDYVTLCQLADIPPLTLPTAPACDALAVRPAQPLIASITNSGGTGPRLLSIRAPPSV